MNISLDGFKNRLPDKLNIELIDDRMINAELSIRCMRKFTDKDNFCEYNKNENNEIFLIGDSIIDSIIYNLKDRKDLKNFKIVSMAKPGCYLWRLGARRCFENYNNKRNNRILKNSGSTIIIGGSLGFYLDYNQIDKQKFINTLNDFIQKGHKIIFLYPLPIFEENVLEKISYEYLNGKRNIESVSIDLDIFIEKNQNAFNFLNSIKNENISRIFPHKLFCDEVSSICKANENNDIFFVDHSHPSIFGSKMINNLIVEEIKKINN